MLAGTQSVRGAASQKAGGSVVVVEDVETVVLVSAVDVVEVDPGSEDDVLLLVVDEVDEDVLDVDVVLMVVGADAFGLKNQAIAPAK